MVSPLDSRRAWRRVGLRRATLIVALLLALPLLAIRPVPARADTPPRLGDVIVRFAVDPEAGAASLRTTVDGLLGDPGAVTGVDALGLAGTYDVHLAAWQDAQAVAARLSAVPGVVLAEPDRPIVVPPMPASFAAAAAPTTDWGLDRSGASRAWPLADGSGVTVAVLDTGVSPTHPDLAGRLLPGWNFVGNNANTADDSGHGTYVAGVIAGRPGPGGFSGVAPGVRILPVKVLDSHEVGSTASFVAGITYAVDHGARVINISADGIVDSQALDDALGYAEAHSVVVVAAAGNDASAQPTYPGAVSTVLAVSASAQDDSVASFSSYGPFVKLAAPGVAIPSTWWSPQGGDGYATASGTSAAAPVVSGAAALVLAAHPGLSAAAVRQLLLETARDIGSPGIDAQSGYGRLNAYLATRLAKQVTPAGAGTLSLIGAGAATDVILTASGFQPGEVVDVWSTAAHGKHRPDRGIVADAGGRVSADLGRLAAFAEGALSVTAVGEQSGTAVGAGFTVAPAPRAAAFKPIPAFTSTPTRAYFPQTGHSLANGFKTYWEQHGGLAVFGYPISEEFTERNPDSGAAYTVQYFERNRLEYHPELAGTPYEVSLGRLGSELAPQVFPAPVPMASGPGLQYFPQTGYSVSGRFLDYWTNDGGVEQFGFPISQPFEEGGHLVQYFERARFEYHPEFAAPSDVLLSRLGVELARQDGYLR